ncbi:hypothetical protein TNCV_3401101 [Trichonephila clavipes]|nr:hypothetical protein TNCV_3401101 [Trichonephila clavipes]
MVNCTHEKPNTVLQNHIPIIHRSNNASFSHGGVSGYPTRCLLRPLSLRCRNGRFLEHWMKDSESLILSV